MIHHYRQNVVFYYCNTITRTEVTACYPIQVQVDIQAGKNGMSRGGNLRWKKGEINQQSGNTLKQTSVKICKTWRRCEACQHKEMTIRQTGQGGRQADRRADEKIRQVGRPT